MAFWPRSPGGAAAVSSRPWWLPLGTPDPADLAWTWYNQGSCSVADLADGGVELTVPNGGRCARERPVSGAAWTRTLWFASQGVQRSAGGLILAMWARDSSGGSTSTYHYNFATVATTNATWAGARYAAPNISGPPADTPAINYAAGFPAPIRAIRLTWDGTDIKAFVSLDGRNFNLVYSTTPPAAPDLCGFYVDNANSDALRLQVLGWEES